MSMDERRLWLRLGVSLRITKARSEERRVGKECL